MRGSFSGRPRSTATEGLRARLAAKPPGPPRCEAELRRADGKDAQELYPEKQHIVPFTFARGIVGKGGTRATASPANAIGNLTWLSHRQNGLEALADRWTVMDRERDGENLRSARHARPSRSSRRPANRA